MKLLKKYPLIFLFFTFLVATAIANQIIPERDFSEMENRNLSRKPAFSIGALMEKADEQKYTNKFERYVNDQFIGRDTWITLKSVFESVLGKIANNGVIYGKNDFLFESYTQPDNWRIDTNLKFLSEFFEKYKNKSHFTVGFIPSSYAVLPELTPKGFPNVDQKAYIASMYDKLPDDISKLDIQGTFEKVQDKESLYYRTDHHWTTLGAFRAYRDFAKSRGLKALESLDELPEANEVTDFYGSFYSKCKLFSTKPDTIKYYDIPFTSLTVNDEKKTSLYDSEKWNVRDKYAGFLWSNNGMTVLKSDNNLNHESGKTSRILLFKDSYSNCMAPFLTYSYDEVYIVDLRFLPEKVSELMKNNKFDDVLVLYGFSMSFSIDSHIAQLTY